MRRTQWLLTTCALLAASISIQADELTPASSDATAQAPVAEPADTAPPAASSRSADDAVILHQPRVRALYRRPAEQGAGAEESGSLLLLRSGRSDSAGPGRSADGEAADLGPATPLPRAGGIYIEPELDDALRAPDTFPRAPRASYSVVPPAARPGETGHYGWVPSTEPVDGEFIEVYYPAVYRRLGDGSLQLVEEARTIREQKVRIILTRQWIPTPPAAANHSSR